MASGIYLWTVNRPRKVPLVYVGQATDLERRRAEYIKGWKRTEESDRNNVVLRRAARKYGPSAVSYRVLELVNDQSLLDSRERHWYWHYKAQEELGLCEVANLVEPGGNPIHRPEVNARRLERLREVQATDEWRETHKVAAQKQRQTKANWSDGERETFRQRVAQAKAKQYKFISPQGEVVTIENLKAFCAQNGLFEQAMYQVARGSRNQHKGWTRYQEEEIYQ